MTAKLPSRPTRTSFVAIGATILALVCASVGFLVGRSTSTEAATAAAASLRPTLTPTSTGESVALAEDVHALREELRALREEVLRVRSDRAPVALAPEDSERLARRIDALEAARGLPGDRRADVLAKLRTPEPDLFARLVREYDARPLRDPNDDYDQWMSDWERKVRDQLTLAHQLWHADDVIAAYGRPTKVDVGPKLTYLLEKTPNATLELSFFLRNDFVSDVDVDVVDAAK